MILKPYSKAELGMAYAPHLTQGGAVNRLMSWINHDASLTEALSQCGYSRHQKVFTIKQVGLIFEHLGEP